MNTDIDGSVIVILSAKEARTIYDSFTNLYREFGKLHREEYPIVHKIAEALNLPYLE